MIRIEEILLKKVKEVIHELYNTAAQDKDIQIQKTRREFKGDVTIVVFPLLRFSKKPPEKTAEEIGNYLVESLNEIENFSVIKGFLNLIIQKKYWTDFLKSISNDEYYGLTSSTETGKRVMIEFSSPNTNKPLHLGHIRNNLLGFSVSKIMEATGNNVKKVNLVNDRGIHICKSMLAWKKYGNGETPETRETKGDHLVGNYYVMFDKEYKKELNELKEKGISVKEAEQKSVLLNEAREMLRKWENNDPETTELWEKMNHWVYEGFDETYRRLGVEFDKIYYESNTYKLGKELIKRGLEKGVFFRKNDGSVWVDLSDAGLDEKLLLRSDGTSVYITQDLGTANERYQDFQFDRHIYVVGNEQNYHFQVLVEILKKLEFSWAEKIYHLSYGMVELPEGKMKSREGKVVDADDLINEMEKTAREMSDELGKLGEIPENEKNEIYRMIGLGALKYFILKVDPKKNMTFDPVESIDFNGNTGPFIQYTYARINSVLRKSDIDFGKDFIVEDLNKKEISLIKLLYEYPSMVNSSAMEYNPSIIANFMYEIAREYNQFYHDYSILNADTESQKLTRLHLSKITGEVIRKGMNLLGIEMPEKM